MATVARHRGKAPSPAVATRTPGSTPAAASLSPPTVTIATPPVANSTSFALPAVVSLLVALVYLSTVYPSVTGGDSGELIVTTCNLGIAHPPGYPTYTMLGWLWLQLTNLVAPLALKAYRINCMCAIIGALAAGIIAWATASLAARTAADRPSASDSRLSSAFVGLYSGLGFAFMPTVWLYSIQGEVFALNNMLCALLIALTVKYYRTEEQFQSERAQIAVTKKEGEGKSEDVPPTNGAAPTTDVAASSSISPRTLVTLAYLGAFVCGVCLTNQHTTVFPVLVTAAFISWSLFSNGLLPVSRVIALILCVVLGMVPYLFILIRSHWLVIDSWGDQRTLAGFLVHLLRQEYGTFQLAASELSTDPGMVSRLAVYLTNMRAEMMIATPILAIIGLYASLRSASAATRRSALVLILGYALYVVVFHKLANLDLRPLFLGVQARFWQQCNIYVWIFSGIGVKYICTTVQNITTGRSSESASPPRLAAILALVYCVVFVGTHFTLQYPVHNHRANDSFYVHGLATLRSFPKDSIVLLNGDLNNNLIKYPQQCEGERPDLSLLSLQLMSWDWFVPVQRLNYPNVTFPGVRYHVSTPQSFNIRRFLDANIKSKKARGGIFLCGPFKDDWYEEHPFGLCNRLLPHGSSPKNLTTFLRRGWSGLARLSTLPPYESWKYGEETWEQVLYRDNLFRLGYLASYASFHSNKQMGDPSLLHLAYDLTEEMRKQEHLFLHFGLMREYEYRSAGVIYGMWARHLASIGSMRESEAVSRRLYYAWRQYDRLHPNDPEIFPALQGGVNPYTSQKFVGLEDEAEFKQLPPLAAKPPPTPPAAKNAPTKKQPAKKK